MVINVISPPDLVNIRAAVLFFLSVIFQWLCLYLKLNSTDFQETICLQNRQKHQSHVSSCLFQCLLIGLINCCSSPLPVNGSCHLSYLKEKCTLNLAVLHAIIRNVGFIY